MAVLEVNFSKDPVIMDFNACGNEKKLKLLLEHYKQKFPNEDGDNRPKAMLAYFKKWLTFRRSRDARDENKLNSEELESYAATLTKTELIILFQSASLFLKSCKYESDFDALLHLFDRKLIDDDTVYERYLLEIESGIWWYPNWLRVMNELAELNCKSTEKAVIRMLLKDCDKFWGNLAEGYWISDFLGDVKDICVKYNFKTADIELARVAGAGYFVSPDWYGGCVSFITSNKKYFEESYRSCFHEFYNNQDTWLNKDKRFSGVDRSIFTFNEENREMFQLMDEFNSAGLSKDIVKYIENLQESDLDENAEESKWSSQAFDKYLVNDDDLAENIFNLHKRNEASEFAAQVIKKILSFDKKIPLHWRYVIISKDYLAKYHDLIARHSEKFDTPSMFLMEQIILAVWTGSNYAQDSKLLMERMSEFNAKEQNYFRELFLTENKGIRDLGQHGYYHDEF